MKIAHLAVGDHSFYLPPDEVEYVTAAASVSRATGEWLEFRDAGGHHVRLLIPPDVLLVVHEYEVEDASLEAGPHLWENLDFEI